MRWMAVVSMAGFLACGELPPTPDAAVFLEDDGGVEEVVDAGSDAGNDAGASPDASILEAQIEALRLELDLPSLRLGSTLTLRSPDARAGCVQVHGPDIHYATWGDGYAAHASRSAGILTVCDAPPAATRRLTTHRTSIGELTPGTDQGFNARNGAVGRFTISLAWVKGCDLLVACDPTPRVQMPLEYEITHAPDERVLCPGQGTVSATRTTCSLSQPAPLYSGLTVVAATNWSESVLASTDAGTVTLFDSPTGQLAQGLPSSEVAATLEWFTRTLGPLPYGRDLRLVAGPLIWLGFEGPGLILINEATASFMLSWPAPVHHVFAHELAHQWAGNRTTLLESSEFTVKEALAEYLAYRAEFELFPARADATRRFWRRSARFASTYPRPTDLVEPPLLVLAGDGSVMGPMMLLQLESVLGADVVLEAVRDVLRNPGAIGWRDVQRALELRSNRSLSTYFDTWVFGTGEPEVPELNARSVTAADGGWELEVAQRTTSGRRVPMTIDVDVTTSSGVRRFAASFGLQSPTASTRIALDEAPTGWTIDPDSRWLWFAPTSPLLPEPAPPRFIY